VFSTARVWQKNKRTGEKKSIASAPYKQRPLSLIGLHKGWFWGWHGTWFAATTPRHVSGGLLWYIEIK
jgi:hypothetical protein